MTELYNRDILRLTATLSHTERLENPHATITKTSRICGSKIIIDVMLEDGVITHYGQEVKACALGQASAAIVAEHAIGLNKDSFLPIAGAFETMINDGTALPEGAWEKLVLLESVKDHPSRKGSVMLPFEALRDVFGV